MKKFEEELNNGLVSIGQNIITKEYAYGKGALINYFKDWVSPEDHQKTIEDLTNARSSITNLMAQLDYYKKDKRFEVMAEEILSLRSQLEKQQPEIPEFVVTEIERLKSEGIKTLCDFYNCDVDWMTFGMEDLRGDELAVAKWFYHNTETFELAYSYGYTVAKEKRFYLKDNRELESVGDTCIGYVTLYLKNDGYLTTNKTRAGKFTQQEIDSMAADSYEQIEVEE